MLRSGIAELMDGVFGPRTWTPGFEATYLVHSSAPVRPESIEPPFEDGIEIRSAR